MSSFKKIVLPIGDSWEYTSTWTDENNTNLLSSQEMSKVRNLQDKQKLHGLQIEINKINLQDLQPKRMKIITSATHLVFGTKKYFSHLQYRIYEPITANNIYGLKYYWIPTGYECNELLCFEGYYDKDILIKLVLKLIEEGLTLCNQNSLKIILN